MGLCAPVRAQPLPHTLSPLSRARAIKYRQENQEAVGGFFSQIGELYVVHHLWGRTGNLLGAGPREAWDAGQGRAQWKEGSVLVGEGTRSSVLKERARVFPTAYKDLQSREETRNAAWRKRGWDQNVYYTGEYFLCESGLWETPRRSSAGRVSLRMESFPLRG